MAVAKVYNGVTWLDFIPKVWTGATWTEKGHFWDGSSWVPLYPSGLVQVADPTNVSKTQLGLLCHAGIIFQTDGGLDQIGPGVGTYNPIVAGNWWSEEPEASIGSSYDVRCASISSGTWSFAAAATGTWVNISTAPQWRVTVVAMAAPSVKACTATFEIRPAGGGATLASWTTSCQANN